MGAVYGVRAQSDYPIYVTPTLIPPYSLKLSDYSKFGSQQLMVNIVVNDLNIANLPVKLRIKLETVGITIENPPTINTTPIFLDGGAAMVLSGDDLKDYFDINNLIFKGYGKEAYKRSGQLPEGFYKITVEVLHFQTNRLISNQGSATSWIALGKPPVLKLPENNTEMGEFKGMPLVFSWLPSNVGSPVSANSVQYKFEMWEMRVNGISPYVVASSVPVFHEETTQNTNISIYPSSLLMEPGMKYAWRVTASDLNGFVPFEQDGHSEIRVITYKSRCDSVTAMTATSQGKNGIFKWEPKDNHTSFNVEMRNPVTGWTMNSQTYDSKSEFFDLEYGAKYELRVQAVCNGDPESVSDFSQWKTLIIPKKRTTADTSSCPDCKCDDKLGAGTVDNIELKKDLKPGDTIVNRYGTTRFIVKSVEPQGDGVYKGQFLFWAELWKLKFLCNYWDLSVNTNKEIVNMDYESVYNPQYLLDVDATTKYLDKLAGEINELTINATIKDTIAVNETITSIYVNAGDSLIAVTVGPDGTLHEVVIQPDTKEIEKTMVKGANGEEYVVNRDGEIMGVKEYQNTGGGNSRKMDEYTQKKESEQLSATTSVQFSASPNQKYGFDAFSNEKQTLATEYPDLKNGYKPTYKSIASYSPDKVAVSSAGNGITFRDEMGIPAIVSGTELTVRGGTDGSVTSLYAYKAVNDTTEEIAGKLNIMSYDEQTEKVYIIPVNKAKIPDAIELQKALNTIYGQAVTHWEVVKIDKDLQVTFENGNMTHGGSSAISVYNTDQKSIINKFKETDDYEKDALYLFFVDNVQSKTADIAGYMPLQRQVGFIYDNPGTFIIAHELSHGSFNLRHTFSPEKLIAQKGTTKNLMDYNSGSELWKHQWNLIHDPQSILFAWAQSEEEGESKKLKGTFKTWVEDTLMTENKILINKSTDKLYAQYTPEAGDTSTKKINLKVCYKLTGRKDSTVTNWTVDVNKKITIGLDSLPDASYFLTFKDVGTIKFFLRKKKYDYACTDCGRNLVLTVDELKLIFPSAKSKLNNADVVTAFNDAFKKAGFKTCNHFAHFLAQITVESGGLTNGTEGSNYYLHRMLEVFNGNATTKFWYKQDFWNDKKYLKFVSSRIYEKMESAKYNYDVDSTNLETWTNSNNTSESIEIPKDFPKHNPHTSASEGYKLNTGKGLYRSVTLTDAQKLNNGKRLLNVAYASKGLGNSTDTTMSVAEGYKYRGRGPLQVTGKAQYTDATNTCKAFGLSYDFEANPDSMANDVAGIWAATAWFKKNVAITDLNTQDPNIITAKVNKKSLGKAERKDAYDKLRKNLFKCTKP
jgi:predicted chitinase